MLRFYTNRELSEKLEINLAKWKRWSREFLPPDPLGGLQSGYARQYSFNDAFKLALGGHLVADLRFTIPEAKQILLDLDDWLTDNGYYFDLESSAGSEKKTKLQIREYNIFIMHAKVGPQKKQNFFYTIRGIISKKPIDYMGLKARQELYIETSIPLSARSQIQADAGSPKLLNISNFYTRFLHRLNHM
jgi:hypothetical protein